MLECKPVPLMAFLDEDKNSKKVKGIVRQSKTSSKDNTRWKEQFRTFVKRCKLPMTDVKGRASKLREDGCTDRSSHIIAMHLVKMEGALSKSTVIIQHDQNPARSRASVDHAPCVCPHGAYYISSVKRVPLASVAMLALAVCVCVSV